MVYAVKKFSYVALEHKTIACSVPCDHTCSPFQNINTLVCAESNATRERCGDKSFLKNRIDDREDSVVQNPISDIRFMNMTLLGIADIKTVITPVSIRPVLQAAMKLKNILFEISLELHDVSLVTFVPFKALPRLEEIFRRDDPVKKVGINFHEYYG